MLADHYATLGVPLTAGAAEIRTAYLALLREYHPDRNPDPAAIERSQAIIAAFKVLGDFDRRNHYDWDRRRERERAQAAASRSPRLGARAFAVGAIGLAAAAWALIPAPAPRPEEPQVVEARDAPPETKREPKGEVKRMAARDAVPATVKSTVKAKKDLPPPKVELPTPTVQLAKAVPPKGAAKQTPAAPIQIAEHKPAKSRTIAKPAPPPPANIKVAARPVRSVAKPDIDLGSLDQFVMNFYGQSWRVGDPPKRAALARSRADFVVRRGGCAADSCKRDAYLKLMRDVSSIVESGPPR